MEKRNSVAMSELSIDLSMSTHGSGRDNDGRDTDADKMAPIDERLQ